MVGRCRSTEQLRAMTRPGLIGARQDLHDRGGHLRRREARRTCAATSRASAPSATARPSRPSPASRPTPATPTVLVRGPWHGDHPAGRLQHARQPVRVERSCRQRCRRRPQPGSTSSRSRRPRISSTVRVARWTDALGDGSSLPLDPRAPALGFNSFIHATHRQNFVTPPRAHRSFPLVGSAQETRVILTVPLQDSVSLALRRRCGSPRTASSAASSRASASSRRRARVSGADRDRQRAALLERSQLRLASTETWAVNWSLRTFRPQPTPTGTATGAAATASTSDLRRRARERESGRATGRDERARARRLVDPAGRRLAQVEPARVLDVRALDARPVDLRSGPATGRLPGRNAFQVAVQRHRRADVDVLGRVADAAVLDVSAGC